MNFNTYWKRILNEEPEDQSFWKSSNKSLSEKELVDIQKFIFSLQQKNIPSSQIITRLQKYNKKLVEKYRAERVFWTETKKKESKQISEAGDNLDIEKYKVILSPHACEKCRESTEFGKKIFKSSDFDKSGYGHVPPFHPNCYCIAVPID